MTLTSPAAAELTYYDPFLVGPGNYALGQLRGQNPPGSGADPSFFNSAWESPTPLGDMGGHVIDPACISYRGTPCEGGSIRVSPAGVPPANDTGNARTARFLRTPWNDSTNQTWYLSFVANFGTTTDGMGYRAVELFPSTTPQGGNWAESRWGDVGYNQFFGYGNPLQQNPSTARLAVTVFGQQIIFDNAPPSYNADGINHLLVFKFEFNNQTGMDNLSVFLDPATTIEPEFTNARFTNLNLSLGAISAVSRFGGGTTGIFDQLRVGTTFADVLPPNLPCPGDVDGNCLVNDVDYAIIRDNFHLVGAALNQGDIAVHDGTIGGDGRVSLGDFWSWKRHRTAATGAGAVGNAAVPEPSTALMVAVLSLLALNLPRRRHWSCALG